MPEFAMPRVSTWEGGVWVAGAPEREWKWIHSSPATSISGPCALLETCAATWRTSAALSPAHLLVSLGEESL